MNERSAASLPHGNFSISPQRPPFFEIEIIFNFELEMSFMQDGASPFRFSRKAGA
jgi:hypothetical protein